MSSWHIERMAFSHARHVNEGFRHPFQETWPSRPNPNGRPNKRPAGSAFCCAELHHIDFSTCSWLIFWLISWVNGAHGQVQFKTPPKVLKSYPGRTVLQFSNDDYNSKVRGNFILTHNLLRESHWINELQRCLLKVRLIKTHALRSLAN